MKHVRLSILLISCLICHYAGYGQQPHPFESTIPAGQGVYSTLPVKLDLLLAGGFAEIRSNHFHSGLDIRTGGKEGIKVYAPADGYVSRINISAWGGGKVLYITHPDGYRTVYMHLSAFCGDIGRFVHDYQYSHHLFAFDIELPKDSIRVTKGQLVALTGNTGGSGGPHLHYEIRYADNDQPINPLYFGLSYNDPVPPTIAAIKIYPANTSSTIEGSHSEFRLKPLNTKSKKGSDTISVAGAFYTGIYTYDGMEAGSASKNGVEKIELYVDGILFHRYQVPTFMFEETRAINAIIDYPQYQRNREYFIVTRHLRGDRNNFSMPSPNHPAAHGRGCILFDANTVHRMEYKVSDYKGNTTSRTFFVKALALPADNSDKGLPNIETSGVPISYFKHFTLTKEEFSVDIEPYTVYENDQLVYSRGRDAANLSPLHRIALKQYALPPHRPFSVRLAIPSSVPSSLRSKLTIVCINGKNASSCATTIEGQWLKASSRNFGGFAVRLDTVPPTITALNFSESKQFGGKQLRVKINDDLTGVVSYTCHVNGEWQLAEHDGKTSSLSVDAAHLRKGTNRITFTLTDGVGNTTEKTWKIIR